MLEVCEFSLCFLFRIYLLGLIEFGDWLVILDWACGEFVMCE